MTAYFEDFEHVQPPELTLMSTARSTAWQLVASMALGFGAWYLWWRWSAGLNDAAPLFSVATASAETLAYAGLALFIFDIWKEPSRPLSPAPVGAGHGPDDEVVVDIVIASLDEPPEILRPTIRDALSVRVPPGFRAMIHLADDGCRPEAAALATEYGIGYFDRPDNLGYKAGNLRHVLFRTNGAFLVICDADTRLFPGFLENTLGYFNDSRVGWVQTPHWFYEVPEGVTLASLLRSMSQKCAQLLPLGVLRRLEKVKVGGDPFFASSLLFFDVIQRRRDRNHASFCCGAGSVHRRDALFASALARRSRLQTLVDGDPGLARGRATPQVEPFRFHVSEDICTSRIQHGLGWRSVYHPRVEAKMLSPRSYRAWTLQSFKYAGGSFDLFFNEPGVAQNGMPLATRLHYLATFWSYLSALWSPILIAAPIIALMTGVAPVGNYASSFFAHLLPFLVSAEIALAIGSKSHAHDAGRRLALSGLVTNLRGLWVAWRRLPIRFVATPKIPTKGDDLRLALPGLLIVAAGFSAIAVGVWSASVGRDGYDASFLTVNTAWIVWNSWGLLSVAVGTLTTGFLARHAPAR